MLIDISGMDAADILRRLFNAANAAPAAATQIESKLFGETRILSIDEARRLLDRNVNIDYLAGRPLKLDFRRNPLDVRLYDRDHGTNAAIRALGIELGDPRITF